jgi:hypothetical protein
MDNGNTPERGGAKLLVTKKPDEPKAAKEWVMGLGRLQIAMWLDAYMFDRCKKCGRVSENVDDWLAQGYRFAGEKEVICESCFKGEPR